jgi:hypothetical protein
VKMSRQFSVFSFQFSVDGSDNIYEHYKLKTENCLQISPKTQNPHPVFNERL